MEPKVGDIIEMVWDGDDPGGLSDWRGSIGVIVRMDKYDTRIRWVSCSVPLEYDKHDDEGSMWGDMIEEDKWERFFKVIGHVDNKVSNAESGIPKKGQRSCRSRRTAGQS